jgi:hypothetical protein
MELIAFMKSADAFATKFNTDNEAEIKFALVCTDEEKKPNGSPVPPPHTIQVCLQAVCYQAAN